MKNMFFDKIFGLIYLSIHEILCSITISRIKVINMSIINHAIFALLFAALDP